MGARGLSISVALILSPYIVHEVGLRAYGFWALAVAIAQYSALLDLGIGQALNRFVADLDARQGDAELDRKVATAVWATVAFAVVLTAVCAALVVGVSELFSPGLPQGWETCAIGAASALGLTTVASSFQAIPAGLGRWDLMSLTSVAGQLAWACAVVATLESGMGLAGLGIAQVVSAAVVLVTAIVMARRMRPSSLGLRTATRTDARDLWQYGRNLLVSRAAVLVNAQADKVFLLAFAPLSFVGLYDLGSRAALAIRALALVVFGPMTVNAARRAATGSREKLRTYYARMVKSVLIAIVAPLLAVSGACYPLVLAWLGPGYEESAIVAALLGLGFTINLITGPGTSVANGSGRPQLDRDYSMLGLAINIALTLVLGILIGKWGVVIATVLGLSISSAWLLRRVDRWLGTDVATVTWFSRNGLVLAAVGLAFGAACIGVEETLRNDSRWISLVVGGAMLSAFAVTWGLLALRGANAQQLSAILRRRQLPAE